MTAKGSEEDEFLETGAESATEVVEIRSGGCAGIDEISWSKKLGARLLSDELQSKVEHLRQQLLGNDSDVKKVRNALKDYDISVNEQLIALVKRRTYALYKLAVMCITIFGRFMCFYPPDDQILNHVLTKS